LDKLKEYLTIKHSIKWARKSCHHIEILLSSHGEEKKNIEGLLWGKLTREPIPIYIHWAKGPVQGRTPPQPWEESLLG